MSTSKQLPIFQGSIVLQFSGHIVCEDCLSIWHMNSAPVLVYSVFKCDHNEADMNTHDIP